MNVLYSLGHFGLFSFSSFCGIGRGRHFFNKFFLQFYRIGASSLFFISLIALFTGLVLGLQAYYAMRMFGAEGMLGALLSLSLVRELAPVLTAIMLAGRAGSAMAAEIGHMRISEQIDALKVMGIEPIMFLISPRLCASIISFPLLTGIFNVIGLLGGYISACLLLGLSQGTYFSSIEGAIDLNDIYATFIKAVCFGILVCLVCTFRGYNTHHDKGAKGSLALGNSITEAVVCSSILVLIADYVLTVFLLI